MHAHMHTRVLVCTHSKPRSMRWEDGRKKREERRRRRRKRRRTRGIRGPTLRDYERKGDEERITRKSEIERQAVMEQGYKGVEREGTVLYSESNIEN